MLDAFSTNLGEAKVDTKLENNLPEEIQTSHIHNQEGNVMCKLVEDVVWAHACVLCGDGGETKEMTHKMWWTHSQ